MSLLTKIYILKQKKNIFQSALIFLSFKIMLGFIFAGVKVDRHSAPSQSDTLVNGLSPFQAVSPIRECLCVL